MSLSAALIALAGLGLAQTVAVISPGPSFVIVARTALGDSRAAALWVTFGLGLGTLIWAAAALFGIGVLLAAFPTVYTLLRLLGAAYLLWIAWQLWRHAAEPLTLAAAGPDAAPLRAGDALRRGLLTQLANPKVAVFFGSIFVTFLPADATLAFRATALALAFVIEVSWYGLVCLAFTRPALRQGYLRAKTWIDRGTGTLLGVLSVRLALGD